MTLRPLALAIAFAAATCAARPSFAETSPAGPVCGDYGALTETLRRQYGETLRFRADDARGFALEFFAHADGSWTLMMRREAQACAIASGATWRPEPQASF